MELVLLDLVRPGIRNWRTLSVDTNKRKESLEKADVYGDEVI